MDSGDNNAPDFHMMNNMTQNKGVKRLRELWIAVVSVSAIVYTVIL